MSDYILQVKPSYVMIFFEDAIFLDEPVPQKVKTGAKGNISNKVDGGVSKQPKCGWVGGKKM